MSDSTTGAMGLRDRKRIETRRRIAEAARSLALEHDIDRTTIDAIAARADISPRTFFNYFESKEDAVLGLEELDLSSAAIDAHVAAVAGEPAAEAVVGIVFRVFGDSFGDAASRRERKAVLVRFPQLMRRQVTHMTAVAEALGGAVRTVLQQDPAWGPGTTEATADMLLGMCMTALRAVGRAGSGGDPESVRREVVALIRDTASRVAAA